MPTTAGNKTRSTAGRKKICGVYAFEHVPTGMLYVGSSIDCWKRKKAHQYKGCHFLRCATELGWENFEFHILEECLPKDRFELERDWIVASDCTHPFGFNIRKDPTMGWDCVYTDEMLKANAERNKKFYEENSEAREAASIRTKAYFINNPEARKANSERQKTFLAKNPEVLTAHSKFMKAWFAENPSSANKAVNQLSSTGDFIARHISATVAAEVIGRTSGAVSQAVKFGHKSGGFLWEYADSDQPAAWVAKLGLPHGISRAVNQFSPSGEFICRYESGKDAARAVGLASNGNMCRAIKRGDKFGGFIFKYDA